MSSDWPEHLPPPFYDGLAQFNNRDYFVCHETLERLWIAEHGSVRELYQGIIQIAVGCYHLTERANGIGATRKLSAGARRLERADPAENRYGVCWTVLMAAADRLHDHLGNLGLDRISEYDRLFLPRIDFIPPPLI